LIVADTNLLAYLNIESAFNKAARQVVTRDSEWVAPVLWRSELRNTLIKCLRGGLIGRDEAFAIMADAEAMMAFNDYDVASDDVLEIAAETGCSAYDAEFVVLARELGVPLVTTDRELLEKFPGTAVSPEQFLAGGG
jgi:predicted nucleic acid-binding protein